MFLLIILNICFFKFTIVLAMENENSQEDVAFNILEHNIINFEHYKHYEIVQKFYAKRRHWRTSKLGTLLFKTPDISLIAGLTERRRTIIVYIWNNWSILLTGEDLHPMNHSKFFEGCSVKNCVFTREKALARRADAVLVNVHGGVDVSKIRYRNPNQLWVLYSFESPRHLFKDNRDEIAKIYNFVNIFNWTMTYRSDADVPIPYGRVVPLVSPVIVDTSFPNQALFELVPYWSYKSHDVLLAILIGNCKVKRRMTFIQKLKKYIDIDIYGNCSWNNKFNASCPGHISSDCPVLSQYMFYLVLETDRCRQYFTDKLFFHAYSKGAIPIIWGAPLEDCQKLLPPNSFLHIESYSSFKQLVSHIHSIAKSERELILYHEWRKHYKVLNEHGYYGTKPMQFCRLCEALNYNNMEGQIYKFSGLNVFLDPHETCW